MKPKHLENFLSIKSRHDVSNVENSDIMLIAENFRLIILQSFI